MMESKELENLMAQCIGTENWYKYMPQAKFLFTDGVKEFAENAEAYWFITEVFLMVHGLPEDLYKITLSVANNKADIKIENDEKTIKSKHIPFTDCPEGDWVFFYTDNVFMWQSEY